MKNNDVKKRKKWPVVLMVIFFIIGFLAGFTTVNASKNMKVMNRTLDSGMKTMSEYATLTPVDPGEYRQIKMYGVMKFDVSQYDVEDTGNLSVMKVNMGFMQMVSFIITPYKKNMPMLSMDFMYIMGKRKAYVEFYDLVGDTSSPEYKGVIEKLKKYSIEQMFCDAIRCYMETARELEPLSEEEKAAKLEITQKYCDDLVEQGGVSTDVFKKQLGEEKTKDFFDKVLFGPERYR